MHRQTLAAPRYWRSHPLPCPVLVQTFPQGASWPLPCGYFEANRPMTVYRWVGGWAGGHERGAWLLLLLLGVLVAGLLLSCCCCCCSPAVRACRLTVHHPAQVQVVCQCHAGRR